MGEMYQQKLFKYQATSNLPSRQSMARSRGGDGREENLAYHVQPPLIMRQSVKPNDLLARPLDPVAESFIGQTS